MKEEKAIKSILDKLLKCAYIIIALLAINTLILLVDSFNNNGNSSSKTTTTENTGSGEEESGEYDVSMMESVDMNGVLEAFNSSDTQVIYMGRSTCGYCVKFLPALQQAQSDYGYTTKYLDITTVTEDDVNKLMEKDNDEKEMHQIF